MSLWPHAICNETFEGWDHARVCSTAAGLGYQGLELAPFTLAPRITQCDAATRKQVRDTAERAGLKIIGLHWLLARTEGYQVTSPDPVVRANTAAYLGDLAVACRDFGGDLMVFGSPLQRKIPAGATHGQATDWFIDTFRQVVPHLEKTGVRLLLEPLAPTEADFLQTAREGDAMLDRLNHPLFGLHLDVKAMCGDEAAPAEIIRKHFHRLGHFHANDANRRAPGMGETDFLPILQALRDIHYRGYLSIEVFDYTPDPETIAREGLRHLREVEARLASA